MSPHEPQPLRLDGVSFAYPARPDVPVLTDVSLTVAPGQRVGLIGENGGGKSTLLRLAAGSLAPGRGTVSRPASCGVLLQEHDDGAAATLGTVVERAVAAVRALERGLEDAAAAVARRPGDPEAARAYDEALAEAVRGDPWSLDARIARALNALGLADVPRGTRMAALSGGQRRRAHLAAVLLARPDALLLDEPTNHLDDAGADYLAAELAGWSGPVLMASHDRWLLDRCATSLVDLDPGLDPHGRGGGRQGTATTGGYTDYLAERARRRRLWRRRWEDQEAERVRLEAETGLREGDVFHRATSKSESRITAKFYGDRAAKTVGTRIRSARNRLEALERGAVLPPPEPLRLAGVAAAGPAAAGPAGPVLRADAVAVPGRLGTVSLALRPGDHVLLTGANGAGKSTLLAVLAGDLAPGTGSVEVADGARVGTLAQDEDWPDPRVPAVEAFARAAGDTGSDPVRLGLLRAGDLRRPVGALSPGQRRRLAVAVLLADPPDVLLLDEPTNHLSLALVEDLEAALALWPGTLVLATHDRWLRDRWAGRRLELPPRPPGAGERSSPPRRSGAGVWSPRAGAC